ncbi:MAG TPA: PP2C family serine/threonine-protein phosphatase [Marinospirillum sp.]|uniref:PP2C family serine/threonine-protein phosphatase n=1 Tax=Marinospirillum sp. TaxID=2183934 RepID=UPI002B479092|nr:PP2C family serine/threonine-protein phosphatase [Marinospirillum sp.]HKM15638.1 PP2C family serine/threonine-protein phosphatase [Marinospirillum sp.]
MMSGNTSVWRGLGDSEIGPLHLRLGLPNQDAYHLELESEPLLIAVSDGLGSKPLSQLGAQAVSRAVVKLAQHCVGKSEIEPLYWLKLFHDLWLEELQDIDVEQCRCTALFAMVLGEQTFIAQLGDGDCCIITSKTIVGEQQVRFLTDKDDDLFANQTHSLGNKFQASQWQFCLQPTAELDACFLVTDGIADDLALEHRASFYLELLSQYRQLSDDAVKEDVRGWISQWPVAGHSDDKTIAALYR